MIVASLCYCHCLSASIVQRGFSCWYKGRVVEVRLSGNLVLRSTNCEAGWRDPRASMTRPICISVLCFKVWLHPNSYVFCVCASVPWVCLVAISIIWLDLSWVAMQIVRLEVGSFKMLSFTQNTNWSEANTVTATERKECGKYKNESIWKLPMNK